MAPRQLLPHPNQHRHQPRQIRNPGIPVGSSSEALPGPDKLKKLCHSERPHREESAFWRAVEPLVGGWCVRPEFWARRWTGPADSSPEGAISESPARKRRVEVVGRNESAGTERVLAPQSLSAA